MSNSTEQVDVVVIGAGPSGVIAASLLHKQGFSVRVLERTHFPRFSIGESLLPQCMVYLREAGLEQAVNNAGFQYKNGAAFRWGERYTDFNFEEKFTEGPGTTFQVERADFDKLLTDEAAAQGVDIRFGHTITDCAKSAAGSTLAFTNDSGESGQIECRFVMDASGFGRVLPRLFDLEEPSDFPVRQAVFTQVDDHIEDAGHDRNKILMTIHPEERDIWYWLIPFSGGKCSMGIVASEEQLKRRNIDDPKALINAMIDEVPTLKALLKNAEFNYPADKITGYSRNVKQLGTPHYALLGNAGEFLDPVFSSGVTIAMRSARDAVALLVRQFNGETIDWYRQYELPLRRGVDTFRTFVDAWYEGLFQDIIFYEGQQPKVRAMISSILAGYAWDEENPFVAEPTRRMKVLAEYCRPKASA